MTYTQFPLEISEQFKGKSGFIKNQDFLFKGCQFYCEMLVFVMSNCSIFITSIQETKGKE